MARLLEVMVSSRNFTKLADGRTLSDLRKAIKAALQAVLARPDGENRISVWINEDSEAIEGSSDWYDESMDRVREAAVVLVLFSGEAGSVPEGREIGICHAEMQAALADAPTKVRAVDVRGMLAPVTAVPTAAAGERNTRFVKGFDDLRLITRRPTSFEVAVTDAVDAVGATVLELALGGVTSARRGQRALGAALDWRRMTFPARKAAMEEALVTGLEGSGGMRVTGRTERYVHAVIAGESVLLVANAAPEGLSLASSRELVGQPHRNDHLLFDVMGDSSGPVHLLACPAGVTVTQIRALMGATELVTAETSTGIWAADAVSRGQVLALRDCIDATSIQIQLEAAFQWLRQSGEDTLLVKRARRRRAVIEQMAADDGP